MENCKEILEENRKIGELVSDISELCQYQGEYILLIDSFLDGGMGEQGEDILKMDEIRKKIRDKAKELSLMEYK